MEGVHNFSSKTAVSVVCCNMVGADCRLIARYFSEHFLDAMKDLCCEHCRGVDVFMMRSKGGCAWEVVGCGLFVFGAWCCGCVVLPAKEGG